MLIPLLTTLVLAATPKVGDVAPDFTVADSEGHAQHLTDLVAHETVVLAFFPKAFSGGCTKELTNYTKRYADIQNRSGHVLAVSTDDAATLNKFKASLKAPFTFVPDPDAKLTNLYDVKMPVLKLAQRYTFVIGPDRKILKIESGNDAIAMDGAVAACPMRKAAEAAAASQAKGGTPAPAAQTK